MELQCGLIVAREAGSRHLFGLGKRLFEDGVLGVIGGDPRFAILFDSLTG